MDPLNNLSAYGHVPIPARTEISRTTRPTKAKSSAASSALSPSQDHLTLEHASESHTIPAPTVEHAPATPLEPSLHEFLTRTQSDSMKYVESLLRRTGASEGEITKTLAKVKANTGSGISLMRIDHAINGDILKAKFDSAHTTQAAAAGKAV